MNYRKTLPLIGSFLIMACSFAEPQDPAVKPIRNLTLYPGRSFGYTLGDLIQHDIHFTLDKPYQLESSALPRPGPVNKWLELRQVDVQEVENVSETFYKISVTYQIFPSLKESETRTIAGFPLRIYDGNHRLSFVTPKTSLILTPLIPNHLSDADVAVRPAIKPFLIPLTLHRWMLTILFVMLACVSGYLAWKKKWLPFLTHRKSPFVTARKDLKRWQRISLNEEGYRKALRTVHRAFNEKAGETVFSSNLDHFFQAYPDFLPMREKTDRFFRVSQQIFFTHPDTKDTADYSILWLDRLCLEYYKIECKTG